VRRGSVGTGVSAAAPSGPDRSPLRSDAEAGARKHGAMTRASAAIESALPAYARRTSSATSLSGCRACASRETTAVSSAETTACTDVDPATRSPIALAGAPHSSSASTVSAASSDAGRPRTAGAAPGRKRRPTNHPRSRRQQLSSWHGLRPDYLQRLPCLAHQLDGSIRRRMPWQGGGRRFESVRGLRESACKLALCCCLLVERADTFRTHLRYAGRVATPRDVFRHNLPRETRSR